MSLRDEIMRHQLLLMRLIKTQAKVTHAAIKEAEGLVLKHLKEGGRVKVLADSLEDTLSKIPKKTGSILDELAAYEALFIYKKIKKYIDVNAKKASNEQIKKAVATKKVGVTLTQPKQTIDDMYNSFAKTKKTQLLRVLSDAKVLEEEPEITATKVSNLSNGLFKVQSLALAGIGIHGTASIVRSLVASLNNLGVIWTADFENSNVCPYCEEQDGEVFEEETGDIPAHANCACFWTINEA